MNVGNCRLSAKTVEIIQEFHELKQIVFGPTEQVLPAQETVSISVLQLAPSGTKLFFLKRESNATGSRIIRRSLDSSN